MRASTLGVSAGVADDDTDNSSAYSRLGTDGTPHTLLLSTGRAGSDHDGNGDAGVQAGPPPGPSGSGG